MQPDGRAGRGILALRVAALALLAAASACTAVPPPAPPAPAAVEQPTYAETGMASWYGRDHQGKKTAAGERFDMNQLTAAHRTLPLNTTVRVTNIENQKTVKVRINDRGPYVRTRIIDLSSRAARALDIVDDGTAKVRLEVFASDQDTEAAN
jgi:rare lipoprotein A (peptidoglycan hydrolase)